MKKKNILYFAKKLEILLQLPQVIEILGFLKIIFRLLVFKTLAGRVCGEEGNLYLLHNCNGFCVFCSKVPVPLACGMGPFWLFVGFVSVSCILKFDSTMAVHILFFWTAKEQNTISSKNKRQRTYPLRMCYCVTKLHRCFHYDVDSDFVLHSNYRCSENVDVATDKFWPVVTMYRHWAASPGDFPATQQLYIYVWKVNDASNLQRKTKARSSEFSS